MTTKNFDSVRISISRLECLTLITIAATTLEEAENIRKLLAEHAKEGRIVLTWDPEVADLTTQYD